MAASLLLPAPQATGSIFVSFESTSRSLKIPAPKISVTWEKSNKSHSSCDAHRRTLSNRATTFAVYNSGNPERHGLLGSPEASQMHREIRTLVHVSSSASPQIEWSDEDLTPTTSGGDGGDLGGNGTGGSGDDGSGGGGAGDSAGDSGENEDFGPILGIEEVSRIAAEEGIQLPQDMLDYAKVSGIPALFLQRYINLQKGWLGPVVGWSAAVRDRLLADPSFLFKVGAEVAIDSCCATFAEVQKRGNDFWKEFDLYASDLLVGITLDVALVGMLAPAARFSLGPSVVNTGLRARVARTLSKLPNSIFEAALPGQSFTVGQRVATWFVKGGQYGVAGFGCGLVGQGIATGLILAKRQFKKPGEEEEEIELPSILSTAALWSAFMGISSNTRYQAINGLERVVESSILAKRVPLLSSAFTVGIRFGNNVFGGMQFVDWARWSGVQ